MRFSFLLVSLLAFLITGCASFRGKKSSPIKQTAYAAPSSFKVSSKLQSTRDSLAVAKVAAAKQDWQTVTSTLQEADTHASATQGEFLQYQESVRGLTESLNKSIGDRNDALKERDDARLIVKQKDDQIHELAKERDLLPFVVAAALGLWLVVLVDVFPIPAQYRIWIKAITFVGGFAAGYALGRAAVRALAQLLP